jgi:long-chain fatty acid transport protein
MIRWRVCRDKVRAAAAALLLCSGLLAAQPAVAGGLILYEVGTADVGLASAGFGARAQDASTVFTNPAGMTRLAGTQFLASGQLLWDNVRFSIGSGTSAALGNNDGGYAVGSNGWIPGAGLFVSHSLSPDLKAGFALAANFGAPVSYDSNWVGRYYVQEATLLGVSMLPSIAYKATDKLSVGANLNVMYAKYYNQVAINNINPASGDGQLKLDDNTWGWGVNLGLLYELNARTRLGLTWNSQVDLDFEAPAQFSNLAPGLSTLLGSRGLLGANVKVGIHVPQQVMGSVFTELGDDWALLGSVGWQQWSKFGQVGIGISDSANPTSLTTDLNFDDTWHAALGAQYRLSKPWRLNFGVAYDSGFQDGSNVSPVLPLNAAWRFGAGADHHADKNFTWGFAAEYIYGGTLDTNQQNATPVALGGRGNVVGSYENAATYVFSIYGNWTF